ncbi:universal stress protein [Sphingobacterium phlebotomi]|uniref:Universal stress protein n=1 Tax=Sphingobacterium phlebotomi TaxID=2605433 RepID=A0A5D4H1L7_9SPHI|nr:universal stress protein [Sphingobacterium phlebotomi]TYR34447.1 universal stress protein [Sphingobacterium phlebotomi]
MKTIIITTDFSESALNAARYATKLAKSINANQIVLYHAYDNLPVGTDLPMTDVVPSLIEEQSFSNLRTVQAELEQVLGEDSGVGIHLITNNFPLLRGIEGLAEEWHANLVVAGTTGRGNLEQVLIGSNTVNLASSLKLPLLIVPADADYEPIQKVVFACDLRKVSHSTPIAEIGQWLERLGAELLVLNVTLERKRANPDTIMEQYKMHALLDVYQPEYHYTTSDDIAEEIEDFAEDHDAGLIVTIPKSYGFFERLFRRSVSKQLIKKSDIPLLLLREKEE